MSRRVPAFARRAVASRGGPLLDAGAGSTVFTAAAYAYVDRSLGMLEAAQCRGGNLVVEEVPESAVPRENLFGN